MGNKFMLFGNVPPRNRIEAIRADIYDSRLEGRAQYQQLGEVTGLEGFREDCVAPGIVLEIVPAGSLQRLRHLVKTYKERQEVEGVEDVVFQLATWRLKLNGVVGGHDSIYHCVYAIPEGETPLQMADLGKQNRPIVPYNFGDIRNQFLTDPLSITEPLEGRARVPLDSLVGTRYTHAEPAHFGLIYDERQVKIMCGDKNVQFSVGAMQ